MGDTMTNGIYKKGAWSSWGYYVAGIVGVILGLAIWGFAIYGIIKFFEGT